MHVPLTFEMLDQLVGFFAPTRQQNEIRGGRAAVLALLSGLVASLAGSAVLLLTGLSTHAATPLIGSMCLLLALGTLRAFRSVALAIHVTGITVSLGYGLATVMTGDVSLLGWVAMVPLVVLLLSPRLRVAVLWFVVSMAVIAAAGWYFLNDPSRLESTPLRLVLARLMLFLAAIFGLTLVAAIDRQRTQQSLEATRDEANRANGLKSEFLASFSHEIRTPLNGVLGTADALLAGRLEPAVREQLLIIQRSGSSLLRTINDVLEFSRIEAGRLDLFPVATELPVLLNEVVDLFRARANSHGLTLSLVLEPGHPRHVKVDDLRLRQVVQNLVGNAVKFTRQGTVRVRLSGGPAVDGSVPTRICVEDTGPGIAPEAVSRVFTAFAQARPRTDRAEGTGLGLAISKQFVDLMEGTLEVDSVPGQGSTFTIELNLPVAEQTTPTVAAPEVPACPAEALKVLVVDDNEINLKVAVALITRLGHQVVMARDGEQALAAVAAHQPDVVFMDCHMPVMDGLEATRRLRATGDGRAVIALTASVYADDQKRCREAGMNYFVSKPVSLASLQTALREVAGRSNGPSRTAPPEAATAPRRVLVVDDDPQVRRMTVRLLRSEGFEVADAGGVEEALILFERAAPNYLLIDQVLGGPEDGLHFAQRLCSRRAGLHVVVTSGRPPSEEQLTSLISTGGRFLAKPYDRHGLIDSMRAPPAG